MESTLRLLLFIIKPRHKLAFGIGIIRTLDLLFDSKRLLKFYHFKSKQILIVLLHI